MPTKTSNAAVIEPEPETRASSAPVLLLALGRRQDGKSSFIRWCAERSIDQGGEPVIADCDRTNATLSAFFENVIRPESPEDDEVRLWLNAFVDRQIEERFSAFLDLGGGDLVLKTWARSLDSHPSWRATACRPLRCTS